MGFPGFKNDQHLGCAMGVPPFKETPILDVHVFWRCCFFWLDFFPKSGKKKQLLRRSWISLTEKIWSFSREFVLVFVFCIEVHWKWKKNASVSLPTSHAWNSPTFSRKAFEINTKILDHQLLRRHLTQPKDPERKMPILVFLHWFYMFLLNI